MISQAELHYIDSRGEQGPNGLLIHPEGEHAMVVNPTFYRAPLRIECSLHLAEPTRGLRLLFAAGQVLFGEGDDTLLFVDPWTGEYRRASGKGALPVGAVTLTLDLQPTQARVLVNGEERFVTEGTYGRGMAGQAGLGLPSSAQVSLAALTVTGEATTLGHQLRKPQPIDYDGGLVDVLYGQHAQMLDWYTQHMGFKGHTWPGPEDENADATLFSTLSLPDHGAFHLYSVLTRKRLAHWYSERGTVDGHVRFTFQSPNLADTHARLKEQGIRTTPITMGPGGRERFDFYNPEGTRLTAVSYPEKAEKFPDTPFTNFAPAQVGVTDLARSSRWYQEFLGIAVEEDRTHEGSVRLDRYLWLEAVDPEQHVGQVDDAARVYLVCPLRQQFTELHERLAQAGARPSGYMNPPGSRWSAFHFYDPDGNRLNVWSYF